MASLSAGAGHGAAQFGVRSAELSGAVPKSEKRQLKEQSYCDTLVDCRGISLAASDNRKD